MKTPGNSLIKFDILFLCYAERETNKESALSASGFRFHVMQPAMVLQTMDQLAG